jgi:two-component sensor histidine kinase
MRPAGITERDWIDKMNPVSKIDAQRRILTFWRLQIGGWVLYGLAIAVSYIPFRHMRDQVHYRIALLGATFLASFVLYSSCRLLWRRTTPLALALSLSVALSYVLGFMCTVVSALVSLRMAGSRAPLRWSLVAAQAFEATVVLVAWSALYFGIKHYETAEQQRGRALAAEATAREAQLQALRYQLQPHFLFNTLNAISSLVVMKQPELANKMISKLAGLLRNTLHLPESHAVTLREELTVVEEYLSIEQIRFGPRLDVSLDVDSEAHEAQVPRFILQPLVENAIRHGIARCPNGGSVVIRASAIEGRLRIEVENDRMTSEPQSDEKGHGLGLVNTRTRLEKLYGEQSSLIVSTPQNGRFLISMSIPLNTESPIVSSEVRQ